MTPAAIIGGHSIDFAGVRCGVVDVDGDWLVVCSGWTHVATKRFGWRVERIGNTQRSARDWLGY